MGYQTIIVLAIVAVIILGIGRIIRQWNLPAVSKNRTERRNNFWNFLLKRKNERQEAPQRKPKPPRTRRKNNQNSTRG